MPHLPAQPAFWIKRRCIAEKAVLLHCRASNENRHAEVELRKLRMGLHQPLAIRRSLASLVEEEAAKVPGHHQRLAQVIATSGRVLAYDTRS